MVDFVYFTTFFLFEKFVGKMNSLKILGFFFLKKNPLNRNTFEAGYLGRNQHDLFELDEQHQQQQNG